MFQVEYNVCVSLCIYVCVCPFVQLMSLSTVLQVQRDSRSYRGRGTYLLVKDTDATQLFHLCWNTSTHIHAHTHTHTNKLLKPFFLVLFFNFYHVMEQMTCPVIFWCKIHTQNSMWPILGILLLMTNTPVLNCQELWLKWSDWNVPLTSDRFF